MRHLSVLLIGVCIGFCAGFLKDDSPFTFGGKDLAKFDPSTETGLKSYINLIVKTLSLVYGKEKAEKARPKYVAFFRKNVKSLSKGKIDSDNVSAFIRSSIAFQKELCETTLCPGNAFQRGRCCSMGCCYSGIWYSILGVVLGVLVAVSLVVAGAVFLYKSRQNIPHVPLC